MKTYDSAKTIRDLIEYYCMRCNVGLCDCKISAVDCLKISSDRDFKSVTQAKKLADRKTEQTDRRMAIGKRSDATADKYNLYGKTTTDEPQTERSE